MLRLYIKTFNEGLAGCLQYRDPKEWKPRRSSTNTRDSVMLVKREHGNTDKEKREVETQGYGSFAGNRTASVSRTAKAFEKWN